VKAVVIEEPNRVAVKQIADPTPLPSEAVVKVEACGICATDIHVLRGEFAPTRYPIVPGHEFCGEVIAIGGEVRNVKIGDFVAVDPSLFCGRCRQCRAGRFNLCENWNAIGVGSANDVAVSFHPIDQTGHGRGLDLLGTITFVAAESGRSFDAEDLLLAGEIARRAATRQCFSPRRGRDAGRAAVFRWPVRRCLVRQRHAVPLRCRAGDRPAGVPTRRTPRHPPSRQTDG